MIIIIIIIIIITIILIIMINRCQLFVKIVNFRRSVRFSLL